MFTLLKKEISGFFSSLIGYIAIIVFLLINGLFIWVFHGELNILDGSYATLNSLFYLAPWVFLFLVPAITMRLFSEEKRTGTIELLLTRPLSDMQIIFAKYLAGLSLVLFSILPTFLFFLSVYLLGNPVGNIDTGGTWGSYIGLFFLAGIYVAIGVFASSLTANQIVAFISAMIICFLFYLGFEALSQLESLKGLDNIILSIGIDDHYKSMSRGVVDSRDVIYFISVIFGFLYLSKITLESRKW